MAMLHGSAFWRDNPLPRHIHATRLHSGRPSSVIWLRNTDADLCFSLLIVEVSRLEFRPYHGPPGSQLDWLQTAVWLCRRRFVEADLWDRDYLDLVEAAAITIGANGYGEIAFGGMQATLDLGYNRSFVSFTGSGFDEMNEVSGDGHAELLDDDSIEITFAYHNGDEAVLKAKPETSSTACWIRANLANAPTYR